MEEQRKRNKSITKVQTVFQTKPHCEGSMHWDIFPAHSSSLAGSWVPPQFDITKLTDFHTNVCQVPPPLCHFGQAAACLGSGCQLFPAEQRIKSGWVMLLLLGAPF